jgi:hypothetical protein
VQTENPSDDLFTPTLVDLPARPAGTPRPWRLSSQLYVAFLGGPLAAAAVAWLNGRRLGLEPARLRLVPAVGALGLGVALAVAAAAHASGSVPRIVSQVSGIACFFVLRELQRPADHRYRMAARGKGDAYESLLGPGLAIAVVCGLITAAIFVPVVLAV